MLLQIHRQLKSSLFPYTTLFRSRELPRPRGDLVEQQGVRVVEAEVQAVDAADAFERDHVELAFDRARALDVQVRVAREGAGDRKSTRLNSSHSQISYAVFCLKKK